VQDGLVQVLLIENDINNRPFADAVLACLPPLPWSVSDQDLLHQQRQDLRNLRVFSVDPIGKCPSCLLSFCLSVGFERDSFRIDLGLVGSV